jgi:FKBP-type peptidyl-prolyl cis-trans isomerase SlyD
MKIGKESFVSITYKLTVDNEVIENVTAERPLEFIFGAGLLLPAFEANLEGKEVGDKFSFTLTPEDGYGIVHPEAIVELPRSIFMVDGEIEEGLLTIGNQLPMADNQGNHMIGTIRNVVEDTVTMDFNHPLAGKTLNFEGEVQNVREVTPEDIDRLNRMMGGGGGCDCGCGGGCEGESCGCDDCGCESRANGQCGC